MKRTLSLLTALALSNSPAVGADDDVRSLTQIVKDSCTVSSGESYDYCTITESSGSVDRLMAGENVKKETIFEGYPEAIKYFELSKENIRFPARKGYKILLVPVGYNEPNELDRSLGYLASILTDAFRGVNVEFSYLDISMPIGIERIGRWVSVINENELKELKDIIKKSYPVDGIVLALNNSELMGAGGNYPVFSGETGETLYLAIHEVGHHLGLGDGYKRYYDPEELTGSELFLFRDQLNYWTNEAHNKVKPPIKFTGNYCVCLPVYTFYGDVNIMNKYYSNQEVLQLLKNGESPFNPLQIEIMNGKIKEVLKK